MDLQSKVCGSAGTDKDGQEETEAELVMIIMATASLEPTA